ncbi:MAG: hypothetical protein RL757_3248 [Bacteroidota bacterium]
MVFLSVLIIGSCQNVPAKTVGFIYPDHIDTLPLRLKKCYIEANYVLFKLNSIGKAEMKAHCPNSNCVDTSFNFLSAQLHGGLTAYGDTLSYSCFATHDNKVMKPDGVPFFHTVIFAKDNVVKIRYLDVVTAEAYQLLTPKLDSLFNIYLQESKDIPQDYFRSMMAERERLKKM